MKGKKIVPHIVAQAFVGVFVWVLEAFYQIVVPSAVVVMLCTLATVVVSLLTPDQMESDE